MKDSPSCRVWAVTYFDVTTKSRGCFWIALLIDRGKKFFSLSMHCCSTAALRIAYEAAATLDLHIYLQYVGA